MRWRSFDPNPHRHARNAAGILAGAALALGALLAVSPAGAISLQAHTQVRDADFIIGGGFNDLVPSAMAAGHFNGDNRSDLVLCSIENNSCWLYYGTKAIGGARVFGTPDVIFVGPYGGFGASVAFIGDINGDGFEEIAVGAPNSTGVGGVLQGGSLWIFFGRGDGFVGQVGYYDANTTIFGSAAGDAFGFAAASAGHADGDGFADFWVSAPNRAETGNAVGAVYLFRGRPAWASELNDSSAALRLVGAAPGGAFGRVLLGNVDLNNDSKPDLLTSSTKYRDRSNTSVGAAFAYLGPFATDGRTVDATRAQVTFWGNTLVPTLGASLSFAVDFMKEGGRTVIVGAPVYTNNTSTGGSVYLFHPASWACCQQLNTWDAAGLIYTKEASDHAGLSIASGGDINKDGYPDLLVGAPYADVSGKYDAGRVFIVYGKDVTREPLLLESSAEGLEGKSNRSYLGNLAVLADFNGDGWADLLLSSHGDAVQTPQGGAVYGFVGRPRNRPPEVRIIVTGDRLEGSPLSFRAELFDADNDRLTWTWSLLPDGKAHDNALVVANLSYPEQGVKYVSLTVFDGALYNSTTVALNIGNAPPVCELVALGTFIEGQPGQVILNVRDPGEEDLWTTHWNGPAGMSHTGDEAIFRPERGGNFTINVTVVDDDGGVGYCEYFTEIQNVAPTVTIEGPTLFYEGDTALYTATIEDPGLEDRFTWNWTGPDGVSADSAFVFAPNRPGKFSVQLAVRDLDGGVGFANLSITVLNVAPDVSLIMPGSAVEGDYVNISVKQYSGFSFDALTVSWLVCAQGYAEGMNYRIPRVAPGQYCVDVLVFDDDGESVSFSTTLPVTNRAPIASVKLTPNPPYHEGQTITFEPIVGPWETTPHSAIEYSWYLDSEQISNERQLQFQPPVGTHRIGVRALDQDGAATRLNFTITTENLAPLVRIVGDTSLNPGALGTWRAEASDASGDEPRLMWDVDGVQITAGPELQWSTRTQGTHVIRVTADDGQGGVTVASVVVTVSPPPAIGAGIDLRWVAVVLGAAAAFAAGILLGAYVVGRIRERWVRDDEGTKRGP